jgi:small subunit ribosomal protein S17
METKNKEMKRKKDQEIVSTSCNDIDCPTHGSLKLRGRTFNGKVINKFHKRITIEFERTQYIRKYERYIKLRTKIHARLPICIEKDINIGDYVKIMECRPLSKIIHFVVTDKIKGAEK